MLEVKRYINLETYSFEYRALIMSDLRIDSSDNFHVYFIIRISVRTTTLKTREVTLNEHSH